MQFEEGNRIRNIMSVLVYLVDVEIEWKLGTNQILNAINDGDILTILLSRINP